MVDQHQLESMSVDQLRNAALKRNIPEITKLAKQELLQVLQKFAELESMSRTKLLASINEYGVKGSRELPKDQLALIALEADRLTHYSVSDLRSLAQAKNLTGLSRLKKQEIIKKLLDEYVEDLGTEPSIGNRALPGQESFSSQEFQPVRKWLGRAIQISSLIGVILSLMIMAFLPILVSRAYSWIDGRMISISQEARYAAGSIRELSLVLNNGAGTLEAAELSMRSIENSLQNTEPIIDSTVELLGDLAPDIIDNTRGALESAEEGARAVDRVLRNLAILGPLTGVTYDPDQALDEGIAAVTGSLEPLPAALREVAGELSQAGSSLTEVRLSLDKFDDELGSFTEEISDKDKALENAAEDLDTLARQADKTRNLIGKFKLISIVILEILFIGQALGQIAIFYVGLSLSNANRKFPADSLYS